MNAQDILFNYLKDIVNTPENAKLNLADLPPEFHKFGEGMQLFGKWVEETRQFSLALSRGDLSYSEVDRDNVFIAPLKEMQGLLRHLAWQTQQVAKGDYSQTVDFMGEFSEAFNTMTRQLQERRDALISEKQRLERKNEELEYTFGLAAAFTNYTHNMIFIYSLEEAKELFRNKIADQFLSSQTAAGAALVKRLKMSKLSELNASPMWEMKINQTESADEFYYFSVESHEIVWRQQNALLHIISDDTKRKIHENQMYRLAYADPLTGAYNQRYAFEQMESWIKQEIPFVLSFIDVDYLKYCNDTYGHAAGNRYLCTISNALNTLGGILCRIGGDEFMLIQKGKNALTQDQDLEHVRNTIKADGDKHARPQSFSYASCDVPANPPEKLENYIARADAMMYQYKAKNRKPLEDLVYRDRRKV